MICQKRRCTAFQIDLMQLQSHVMSVPHVADLGLHLKGEPRIQFLLDKMKEIRKVYQSIRSEVAAIDRKRKRARRREKEREST